MNMKALTLQRTMPHGALLLLLAALLIALAGCAGGSDSGTTVVAPTIATQPASRTVVAGFSTTLTVVASGSDLQYQWFKDSGAISGATGSSFTITNAEAADAGDYYVVVSNSAGTVTSSAAVVTVDTSTGDGEVIVQ
jgi:hypothetical protein